MQASRRQCFHSQHCMCRTGPLTETIILLVFRSTNWNPFLIRDVSLVCCWFADLCKRLLWKEFCLSRGPRMVPDLAAGQGSIEGGWNSLAKLMLYCAGCRSSDILLPVRIPGHFVWKTRFSKTSGRSFLFAHCKSDVLYITDPCEHLGEGGKDDVGLFRGIFRTFSTSKTRRMLIECNVPLEQNETCPYCLAKGWNMLKANLIPDSAAMRVGAYEGEIDYFVCLNGHLHGKCSLSDSEDRSDEEDTAEG